MTVLWHPGQPSTGNCSHTAAVRRTMSITDAPITTMSENWRLWIESGATTRRRHVDRSVEATSIAGPSL
eukprot:COSAG02_NODE_4950_length_4796_cov_7.041729_3_plen_69_part_00